MKLVVPLAGAIEATVTSSDLITLLSGQQLSIMTVEPGKLVRLRISLSEVTV